MAKMMPLSSFTVVPKTEAQAVRHHDNYHVLNILPVTTLRTIDLGGKKNTGPLFSRFCAEMRVFFEVNSAPEYVHQGRMAPASANTLGSIASPLAQNARMGQPPRCNRVSSQTSRPLIAGARLLEELPAGKRLSPTSMTKRECVWVQLLPPLEGATRTLEKGYLRSWRRGRYVFSTRSRSRGNADARTSAVPA